MAASQQDTVCEPCAHGAEGWAASPAAPSSAAAGAVAAVQLVKDCWEQALDLNSGQPYWFNRASGVSQWHPPPGWTVLVSGPHSGFDGASTSVAGQQPASQPDVQQQQQQCPPGPHVEAPGLPAEAGDAGAGVSAGEAGASQPASPAQPCAPADTQQHGAGPPHAQQDTQHQQREHAQQPQHEWHEQHQQWEPGLYYRDATAQLQGPFTLQQLQGWRGILPMDLPVLRLTAGGGAGGREQQAKHKEQQPLQEQQPQEQQQLQQEEQQLQQEKRQQEMGGSWEQLDLAALLGDEELLERWRLDNPEQAAWPGTAPPAAAYEAELSRGTAHSLAEAVLSGLPAHDEAVTVARLAAAAGKSVQEVAAWNRGVDYAVTGYRVAARGRIQAGGGQEHLYAEAASWADPASLERQLAAAAEKRKRGLTSKELKAVKQRKAELKEKKRREWLLN